MIVRVLGQGQFEVPDAAVKLFDELDGELEAALDANDDEALGEVIPALISTVTTLGTPLAGDVVRSSQLIVPAADSTASELRRILTMDYLAKTKGNAALARAIAPARGAST